MFGVCVCDGCGGGGGGGGCGGGGVKHTPLQYNPETLPDSHILFSSPSVTP